MDCVCAFRISKFGHRHCLTATSVPFKE